MIRFGPAGLGGIKEAISNLEMYHKLGFRACEIAFTYGIYIKEKDAVEIGEKAKELDIKLSIHAPYWINLNSLEKKKIEQSKERILECCKIGENLGAYTVVYHPGFYGKLDKETTFQNIKKAVIEIENEIKKHKWNITQAPETMGKINVFGDMDEILRLVKETGCSFCIDFAHLYARSLGKLGYKEMYEKIKSFPNLHCHFSGINFGAKGELNHKITPESELKKLLEVFPKNKEVVIINESPLPVEDSIKGLKIWKKL
ncbi:MAG: TIM barrel protein [Candidatus Pacearchaeota archaeon]